MADRRILITGGSGRLGTAIRAATLCVAPTHEELDITESAECLGAISRYDPEIIIHCAGYVTAMGAETYKREAWEVNVQGTETIVKAALGRRFIYSSSDYVFDGERGDYSEDDIPHQVNFYGLTKLAGEIIVSQHPNTLIVRAPFRADPPWPYTRAFTDQWTSCDFVSVRAPQIVQVALGHITGILHIGGVRRSIFELARDATPNIGQMVRGDIEGLVLPRDVSLQTGKWEAPK